MSTETANIVSPTPTPLDTGQVPSSLMSIFSDTKHVIHVAIEIIVLGALFYYSKSSNSALKNGIDLLQEQVDEQKDDIDRLKSTVTHLTDAITKLTGVIEKFKIPPPQRQTTFLSPQPVVIAPAPQPVVSAPAPQPVVSAPAPAPAPAPQPVVSAPAPQPTHEPMLETIQEFSTPGAASIDDEIGDELKGLE